VEERLNQAEERNLSLGYIRTLERLKANMKSNKRSISNGGTVLRVQQPPNKLNPVAKEVIIN